MDDFAGVLAAAQRGDEAAFALLWRAHQPPLLRYLRVIEPRAAEDLAAETWLQVIRGLRGFRGGEIGLRAWILRIGRNRALDWRRHEMRRPSDPVETIGEQPATDDTAAEALDAMSTRAALALIATLPPDQAEAVALRVVAGLDVAQVAAILGKRPGAVRVAAHRGLRALAGRSATVERQGV